MNATGACVTVSLLVLTVMGLIIFGMALYILLRPACPACPPAAPCHKLPELPAAPTAVPEIPVVKAALPRPETPPPRQPSPVFIFPRVSPEMDSGITQRSPPRRPTTRRATSPPSSESGSSPASVAFSRVRHRAAPRSSSSYSSSYGGSAIDLHSDEYRSDTEDRPDVYSPPHEETARPRKETFFSMGNTCKKALDAVTFSDFDLFLDTPSTVRVSGDKTRTVRTLIPLKRLVTFSDLLYALGEDGCMYELYDQDFEQSEWRWARVDWLPDGVTFVCGTYDDKNLWVQTKSKGFLYNENHIAIEEEAMRVHQQRVYGYTCADYVTMDHDKGVAVYGDHRVSHVRQALLDSHNRLYVLLEKDAARYSRICFLHWTPTYIQA